MSETGSHPSRSDGDAERGHIVTPSTGSGGPPNKAVRQKKPGRWRRRFLWCCATVLVLLVVFRVSLPFLLPWTLAKVAEHFDLRCTYDRLELSLSGGDAELWHLVVAPKNGGEPYIEAEYCRADIATPYLLVGKLVVRRLEADGLDLLVEREGDGTIPILEHVAKARGEAPASEPSPAAAPPPKRGKIDLTPPIRVDAMRLQHVHATIRDRSVTPAVETRLDLNLRLSHFGAKGRRARFHVWATSPPVLDAFSVEGTGSSLKADLGAEFTLELRGLHLEPLKGYLEPMGIRPRAKDISFGATGRLQTRAAPGKDTDAADEASQALQATIDLHDIAATADGAESIALDQLSVKVAAIGWTSAHLEEIGLKGIHLAATKTPEGLLRAAGLELFPPEKSPAEAVRPQEPGTTSTVGPRAPGATGRHASDEGPVLSVQTSPARAAGTASDATAPAPAPYTFRLDEFGVRDVRMTFRDESVTPIAELVLGVEEFTVRDVIMDPDQPDATASISGRLFSPGMVEEIHVQGEVVPFAPTKAFELRLEASGIVPRALQPYLEQQGMESLLQSGSLTTSLRGSVDEDPDGRLLAELVVGETTFRDEEALLELGGVWVSGVEVDLTTNSMDIEIGEIEVSGPRLDARREASGALRLLGLRIRPPGGPSVAMGEPAALTAASHDGSAQVVPAVAQDPTAGAPQPVALAEPAMSPTPRIKIQVGRFAWRDIAASFLDEAVSPAADVALEDAGLEITNLTVDLDPFEPAPPPATLRAWLKLPGLIETVSATGSIVPLPTGGSMKIDGAAQGITAKALSPYLKDAGLEPALEDGSAKWSLGADFSFAGDTARASLAVENVSYMDGADELAGLGALRVNDVAAGPSGVKIGSVEIEKPQAWASRDEKGTLFFAGMSLPAATPESGGEDARPAGEGTAAEPAAAPKEPPAKKAETGASTGGLPAARPSGEAPDSPAPAPSSQEAATPFAVELASFRVSDAAIHWADKASRQPVETALRADLEMDGVVVGREAKPARLKAMVSAEGILDQLQVNGTVAVGPQAQAVVLDLDGRGLKAGPLAAYLPEAVRVNLKDGLVKARLEADSAVLDEGGRSARFVLSRVDYRDGGQAEPFVRLGSLRLEASRVDPPGGQVEIEEISVGGLEARAIRTARGVKLLGIAVEAPEAVAALDKVQQVPTAAAPPETAQGAQPPPQEAPPPPPEPPVAKQAAGAKPAPGPAARPAPQAKYPLVTLKKLDLRLDRLTVTDERSEEAKPLELTARLANREPLELLGKDPETRKPALLEITGNCTPLVDAINVNVRAVPFIREPEIEVDVDVRGVKGGDLVAVLPELEGKLDGSNLTDGRFEAHLEAMMRIPRRGPLDFDLRHGFGAEAFLRGIRFQNGQDGPVLAGLEELHVDLRKFDTGSGAIQIKEIEIQKPTGIVRRTPAGLEIVGLTIPLPEPQVEEEKKQAAPERQAEPRPEGETKPAPAAPPESAPPTPPDSAAPAAPTESAPKAPAEPAPGAPTETAPSAPGAPPSSPPAPPEPPPTLPGPEIRVERLFLGGIDLRVEDTTTDPPTHLRLNGLEVDVRNATNRILTEGQSTRFSVSVQADKVPLPIPLKGGMIGGALSDATKLLAGGGVDTSKKLEDRELFEDVLLKGKIGLHPHPTGWIQSRIRGFELTGVKGLAAQSGVDIGAGVFDGTTLVKLPGDGSAVIGTRLRFTDLNVSEPPDGPIFRYLHLPAPLNTVLFALKDRDGTISIPLDVTKKPGPFTAGEITGPIITTLGKLIAQSVAQAPMRVVGTVTGFLPFGGGSDEKPEEPIVIEFAPGDAEILPGDVPKLATLRDRLERGEKLLLRLEHEFGAADLARARERANPSPEECRELGLRLRRDKASLLERRGELASRTRWAVLGGLWKESLELTARLRALDRKIAATDLSIERVYALTRPGAERRAPRRTREVALAIARARVDAVRFLLTEGAPPGLADAVRAQRPSYTGDAPEGPGKVRLTITKGRR